MTYIPVGWPFKAELRALLQLIQFGDVEAGAQPISFMVILRDNTKVRYLE